MTVTAQSQPPGGAPISSHVKTCRNLYSVLISAIEVTDSELPDGLSPGLCDQKSCFAVWCGNIGAHKFGTSSLEHRLRDASHIKQRVLGLLEELQGLLKDAADIVSGDVTPWDQMPEDDAEAPESETALDDLPATELEQIAMDVKEVIDNLFGLSITIKNPAPHDRFMASQSTDTSHFEPFDVQHVQSKFPGIEPWLTERLGRSISRRRQYFKYREAHHNKLVEGLDGDVERVAPSTIASSIPDHLKNGGTGYLDVDQGSDTDILSQTSFATSTSAADNALRVPPLPAEAAQGPFECPFCFMIVNIRDRRLWKKHVFGDLRPYICVERQCVGADAEFARRSEWIEHMKASHWTTYDCPDGCGSQFQHILECKAHLESTHPGQFDKYQEEAAIRLNAQQTLSHIRACPLCGDKLSHLKSFQKHVGRHQEQLSLFALPPLEDGNGEDQSDESDGDMDEEGEEREQEEEEEGEDLGLSPTEASDYEHEVPLHDLSDPKPVSDLPDPKPVSDLPDPKPVSDLPMVGIGIDEEEEQIGFDEKTTDGILKNAEPVPPDLENPKLEVEIKAAFEAAQEQAKAAAKKREPEARAKDDFDKAFQWRTDDEKETQEQPSPPDPEKSKLEADTETLEAVHEQAKAAAKRQEPEARAKDDFDKAFQWRMADGQEAQEEPSSPDPEKLKLEAEQKAFKAAQEHAKAAERQRALEAQIRKDAEEAFQRRMEDMRNAQEEAKREIEKAKAEAERAARERIKDEQKTEEERQEAHAAAMAQAEEAARKRFEAEMKAREERKAVEAKARMEAEEAAHRRLEDAIRAAEAQKIAADKKAAEEARVESNLSEEKEPPQETTRPEQIKESAVQKPEASWEEVAALVEEPDPGLLKARDEELKRITAELEEKMRTEEELAEIDSRLREAEAKEAVKRYKEAESRRLAAEAAEKIHLAEEEYRRRLEEQLLQSGVDEKTIESIINKPGNAEGIESEEENKAPTTRGPTFTRMSRRHLSIESLRVHGLDWIMDKDTEYVLIRRWVPEWEQDMLWEHTRELRQRRQEAGNS